jgi:hypothetical protein
LRLGGFCMTNGLVGMRINGAGSMERGGEHMRSILCRMKKVVALSRSAQGLRHVRLAACGRLLVLMFTRGEHTW